MKNQKHAHTNRELWPNGLPFRNLTAPLMSKPLAEHTSITYVKAVPGPTKRVDIKTKSTLQ